MDNQDSQGSPEQPSHHVSPAGRITNRLILATVVLVTAGTAFWGMARVRDLAMVLDETQVKAQVDLFLSGRMELLKWPGEEYPAAAMFPGFQAVLAAVSAITGLRSVFVLRLCCFVFSWAYVFVAYKLARRFVDPDLALIRAAQAYLLPLAFPFHFLLYTDMFSLLVTMTAFWAAVTGRRHTTGLLMIGSLLVRQTNVVFAIFLWAFTYVQEGDTKWDLDRLLAHSRRWLLLGLSILVFIGFVLIHGRVGLDDPSQQPLSFSVGNLAISLVLGGALFLPVHLGNLPAIRDGFVSHPRRVLLVVGVAALIAFTYEPSHRWNLMDGLLRNRLLELLTGDFSGRLLFAVGLAATALSVLATPLIRPGGKLLYPYWFLQLAPVLLVEPRYYFSTFALFVLLRTEKNRRIELSLWFWFALQSVWLHTGITANHFMP